MPAASFLDRQAYRAVELDAVKLHPENRRLGNVESIADSIRVNGFFGACGVQASTQFLIWGNHRYQGALLAAERIARARSGAWEPTDEAEAELIESWRSWPERFGGELDALPIFDLDVDDEAALNILLVDNETSDEAGWDRPGLVSVLADIQARRGSLEGTGFTTDRFAALQREIDTSGAFARPDINHLADRFLVPPFSVLDARQGYWQERKREWLALGIRSEQGRPRNLLKMSDTVLEAQRPNRSKPASDSGNDPNFFWKKQAAEARLGRELSSAEFLAEHYEGPDAYVEGTSIFDPVLCELAYRWFCPPAGAVLDPFAGGSVRGIVASRLGLAYTGVDLRAEQVEANEEQRDGICRPEDPAPSWVVGDSRELAGPEAYDFVFSCPPYFDLEQYSDDPADLCNAPDWPAFCAAYADIVERACAQLRPGRFACFVVGNLREGSPEGGVMDLGGATIQAFAAAGLVLYNDAILVTAIGSLALRAARIFRTRKLGRTHQQVLVFLKPPLEDALAACGEIEVADPAEAFGRALSA